MGRTLNSLYRERRTMKNIALLSLLTLAILQPLAEAQRGQALICRGCEAARLRGREDPRCRACSGLPGREALNATASFGKGDPNTITVTNNLRTLSINVVITLVGDGCAKLYINGIVAGKTATRIVGAACTPTKVVATIVSNNAGCKENVGGTTRSYTVGPNPGTKGCDIAAQ